MLHQPLQSAALLLQEVARYSPPSNNLSVGEDENLDE